jgi:hypothetical protein
MLLHIPREDIAPESHEQKLEPSMSPLQSTPADRRIVDSRAKIGDDIARAGRSSGTEW